MPRKVCAEMNELQGPRRGRGWFILRFSPTNPTISDSFSLVLLLDGGLYFNREIMEFQPFVLFSFVLGSMFHEDKVSSLDN